MRGEFFGHAPQWMCGTWKRAFKKSEVVITASPFSSLTKAEKNAFAAADEGYGQFVGVTGCAVGPDYRAPELTVPARYSESAVHASAGTSLAEWWRVFRDAPLDRLVARAIDANLDLRIAESRVREARALRGVVRSALWPTVDGGAAYSRTRQSENGPLGGAVRRGLVPLETDLYEAALDASWEIDIFGGTRRAVESAEAEIGAADESRRDVLVTLLGEIGSLDMGRGPARSSCPFESRPVRQSPSKSHEVVIYRR